MVVRCLFLSLAALCSLWSPRPAAATTSRIGAVRTDTSPDIDGRLDDQAWAHGQPSTAFTQKFPDEGAPPTERTTVRVIYDDANLYVGIECAQARSPLIPRLARRDRELETDRVTISIDSRRDGVSAFEFGVTATGVLSDGVRYNDTEYSSDWDENWEARTHVDASRWSVEMRIPLRVLRFDALPVQEWGFNVTRAITARQEIAEWAYVPRTDAGVVSRYGRLENLVALEPRHGFELRPFALGKISHIDRGYGPRSGLGREVSVGIDGKAHLGPSLTLDATVNPDFGQVEADEVVLNLTNTETEHPEKRPFFLEGIDTFVTPETVVYTRRIGHVPDAPELPDGEARTDLVAPSRIWAAAKLTGRVADRLTLGALSAVTGENAVSSRNGEGVTHARLADPTSVFNVLRLRREVGGNGHVGLIGTATNRLEGSALYPVAEGMDQVLCPDGAQVELGARCFRDAYVGGLDGRWRSPGGDYSVDGQVVGTLVDRGPARALRDGTTIGSGDGGALIDFGVSKEGGRHWLWGIGASYASRKAELNDLGYLERQNEADLDLELTFRTTDAFGPVLETETDLEGSYGVNLDGLPIEREVKVESEWKLRSFWGVAARAEFRGARFDDREVGDGTALERAARFGGELEVGSDQRRRVSAALEVAASRLPNGAEWGFEGALHVRAIPQLELDIKPELTVRRGEPRYLDSARAGGETSYLFGALDADSLGATVRLTYVFAPRLTLQTYAQVFLVAKHYSEFFAHSSNEPRPRIRLAELAPTAAPDENPDEQEAVLNLNVVLRWEFRLGSTLYLVYTRAEEPELLLERGDRPRLDAGRLGRSPAAHAVMLKLTYWWGG